jgi:hypothetical protein
VTGEQRRKLVGAISTSLLVVAGAVTAALINELHGGWVWWVLASVAALLWAIGTGVLYFRDQGNRRIQVREGGVYGGGSVRQGVETRTRIRHDHAIVDQEQALGEGVDVGPGAVFADGDIGGPIRTETTIDPERWSNPHSGDRRRSQRGTNPPR